ncbi:5'-nucleotidase domain-containing protein 3 [Xenoophorus captivus]|uniref:5'-nucleotidase domain-containing protein 3 n=1 Tax=Xenoophorus captivus TaxID=1517983 RepID=A0ABV0QU26_9TELE
MAPLSRSLSALVKHTGCLWRVGNFRSSQQGLPNHPFSSVDPDTIFANNEMSLRDIEIYGFDYDYTLAFYSSHLHTLIFNIARDILINNHRVRRRVWLF